MYINECVYTYTSNFQEGRELVLAAFLKEPVVIFEPLKNEFRKQKRSVSFENKEHKAMKG